MHKAFGGALFCLCLATLTAVAQEPASDTADRNEAAESVTATADETVEVEADAAEDAGQDEGQDEADDERGTVLTETNRGLFLPSEEISADSAISFPADI